MGRFFLQKTSLQLYNGKFINIIATHFLTCAKNMHVHYYLICTDLMHQPTMHLKISCIHETMHQPKQHPQYSQSHSCSYHQPRLKMAKNIGRQKIFLTTNEVRGPQVFCFWGRVGALDFFCSHKVLKIFPQHVP